MESEVLRRAWEILEELPLCDRCFGRFFARLGIGLDNKLRGEALKLLITLEIHERLRKGEKPEKFREVAANMDYKPLIDLLEKYGLKIEGRKCKICGGELEGLIEKFSEEAVSKLERLEVSTFVVGVSISQEIAKIEEEILQAIKIETYESLKRELKREVGKKIAELTGLKPVFQNPEVLVLILLDEGKVEVKPAPLYIKGRYWKVGRNISQATWIDRRSRAKKYNLSVEEALSKILELYSGEEVKIHAAGREDVDARMLGSGRPVIVEVKKPKHRRLESSKISKIVEEASKGKVFFKPEKITTPRGVRELKENTVSQRKIYRALIILEDRVSEDSLEELKKLEGVVVEQMTPLRVLRRRPEKLRRKKLYRVEGRIVDENLLELLVECEGGLYVKELINGDEGRTRPSISEILGSKAECIELDVLAVK